jgi:hypothetical protein
MIERSEQDVKQTEAFLHRAEVRLLWEKHGAHEALIKGGLWDAASLQPDLMALTDAGLIKLEWKDSPSHKAGGFSTYVTTALGKLVLEYGRDHG